MANNSMDNMNVGYCEYLTKAPVTKKVVLARCLLFVCAAILITVMLVITLKTIPVVSFMLGVIIVFMTWFIFQFTKIEYEYTIVSGELILSKIYGERMRKDVFSFKTADIISVLPVEKLNEARYDGIFYTCTPKAPGRICILYSQNGKTMAIVISAPDKTISCLKYYKRSAFSL